MQPLFDATQGVAPFERGLGPRQRFLIAHPERDARLNVLPSHPEIKAGSMAW